MIDAGFAPATINGLWYVLRCILRRIGPAVTGNPFGLSIITSIPAFRTVKESRGRPYRIPLADLSRTYLAASIATSPKGVTKPADFWRCLLVVRRLRSRLLRLPGSRHEQRPDPRQNHPETPDTIAAHVRSPAPGPS